jgi:fucose permease
MKTSRASNPALVALAYVAFVSLGLPDGLLGVAWPSIRASFGLEVDALGALLVTFTAGYLASSFAGGWLLARLGVGALLALSCLATAASLIGYAVAPAWWVMAALGVALGLGAGAIDAGLNTFAAVAFSARMVNWLHACYGVGAATGPVIMSSVLAARGPWQRGYLIVGGWQLLLAACFALTRQRWPATPGAATHHGHPAPTPAASPLSTLRLPVVWLSVAVFFVYTGVEAAAGAWAYTLFTESRGVAAMTAGLWVSGYWGALTAGRLLSGFVVHFAPVGAVIRCSVIGMALGAALLWADFTDLLGFLGLALMGLSAAAVFPSLISATPARLGAAHTANAVGFQIAAAMLGAALLPSLAGVLAERHGLEAVGATLTAGALLLVALYEALTALGARADRD